jgi:DNA-binding NarL/FixJ family response regulator
VAAVPGRAPLVGRDTTIGRAVGHLTGGGGAVVLAGPAGIGRTRLLEECAHRAAESGFLVVDGGYGNGGWGEGAARPDVPPGALVVVDDLHLLDEPHARALAGAVARGQARLLGSLRTGVPAPAAVTRAWRDRAWERVDVEALGRSDVAEIAAFIAGVPVDGISVERLMTWTAGLPSDLVAVLSSPVPGGWFELRGPVATLRPDVPVAAARALRAGSPMERVPAEVRTVGELVAIGRRVPDTVLTALAGGDAVAAAETEGIARATGTAPDLLWSPASALEGELTRAVVTDEVARAARDLLAGAYAAADLRDPDALLVRADACLDRATTGPDDLALLVDATEIALERRDVTTTIRLATYAWRHGREQEAALQLGAVYELVGDHDARLRIALDALAHATDDRSRVIPAEQAAIAYSALDRHDDATETIAQVRTRVSDPMWAGRLDALLANLLLHEAHLEEAVALAEPYLPIPVATADAALIVAVAHIVSGRTEEGRRLAEIGTEALSAVQGEHRTATPSLLPVTAGIACTEAGDLDAADELIGPVYDSGIARRDSLAQAWAALSLGRNALVRGAVRSAARWFRDAVAGYAEQRHTGYLAWAYSGLAGASALAGDLDGAHRAAAAWATIGSHPVRLYEPDSRRWMAALALAEGDGDTAAGILRAAADQARESGQHMVEVSCLHDLARMGDAREARARLSPGARACDGRLAPTRVAHVHALAAGDAGAVARAAAEFEDLGAWLLAAEAWAGLRTLASGRDATRARLRAHAALARCEGAQPPLLAGLDRPALSTRARETAELAAAGLSRAAIAERLHVSRHTVNRHISDAYDALGVTSREQLPEALAQLAMVDGRAESPASPGEPWPFVGRGDELALLRAAVGDGDHAGVALVGPSGVGKTRLAREFEVEVAAQGRATTTVVAAATSGLALSDAEARLIAEKEMRLLVVDDVQQLDDDSAAALERVLARREVFVVLTVRTDDPSARQQVDTWVRPNLRRVDVAPLEMDEVESLLSRALGGPVLRPTTEALAETSGGNPLWLRELVHAAQADTTLHPRDGVWELSEVGRPNLRLLDLVQSRLVPLDADTRAVLRGLAVAGPLPRPLVEPVVGAAMLERLDHTGLVERDHRGALQLAHPVYGDVLRADLPASTRRSWYARLVDASVAVGPETVDAAQLVTWRLEAGVAVPTRLMAAAAERALALGDLAAAERLAHGSLAAGGPVASHLVLARVAEARGDLDAAADAYEAAAASSDPTVRARAILAGAELLAWSTGTVDGSLALLETGLAADPPPPWPEILEAGRISVHALGGRGGHVLPSTQAPTSTVPAVLLRELLAYAGLRLAAGHAREAAANAARMQALLDEVGTSLLAALGTEIELFALAHDGQLPDAVGLVERRRQVAVAGGDRAAQSGCDLTAGRLALLQGRAASAEASFRDALTDPLVVPGTYRWREAQLGLVRALALGGDVDGARAGLAVVCSAGTTHDVRTEWARAWIDLASHHRDAAVARLEGAAARAESAGARLVAASLWHLALLAHPSRRLARRLRAVAEESTSAVADAWIAQAAAIEARDPAALLDSAERLAAIGFAHSASEIAGAAAALAASQGLPAVAERATRAGARWRAGCDGAIRLTVVPDVPAARLSPRQQQIAELAAEGRTAKEIAAVLGLSIRTVENHLQAAFERLGVNRRGDLAEALGAA